MLPDSLVDIGSIELHGHNSLWRYIGPTDLSLEQMKSEFSNSVNWEGSNLQDDSNSTGPDNEETEDDGTGTEENGRPDGGSTNGDESTEQNGDHVGNSTGELPPNACAGLQPADIVPWGLNSVDDDEIALMALVPISSTVGSLFFTDNAWNGTTLLDIEGHVEVRLCETAARSTQTCTT